MAGAFSLKIGSVSGHSPLNNYSCFTLHPGDHNESLCYFYECSPRGFEVQTYVDPWILA